MQVLNVLAVGLVQSKIIGDRFIIYFVFNIDFIYFIYFIIKIGNARYVRAQIKRVSLQIFHAIARRFEKIQRGLRREKPLAHSQLFWSFL